MHDGIRHALLDKIKHAMTALIALRYCGTA
jgi:hypothetical protein